MKVAIVLALIAVASAIPSASRFHGSGRIVGGEEAGETEFPHQVSIQVSSTGITWTHLCGGAIYSEAKILTTGACLNGQSPTRMRVVAGDHDISSDSGDEQTRNVESILIHERYSASTLDNDIGIITLESPLVFTSRVQPIRIAESTFVPSGQVVSSGYGATDVDGTSYPGKLQKATLNVIERAECDQTYGSVSGAPVVTENMVCAADVGKQICAGDTGSPLVARDEGNREYLAGLVSWGTLPCQDFPSVYTNIAPLRTWLESKLNP